VGRSIVAKSRAASLSGIILLILGGILMLEVVRRFFVGAEPLGYPIVIAAVLNALVNAVNLKLLRRHRHHGVHMKAS
jgi:Co/Zn/Cd efflux system component